MSREQSLSDFLENCEQFHLGDLDTESAHPLTRNLSHLTKTDINRATSLIKEVDELALRKLRSKLTLLRPLQKAISDTLSSGGKVFICGCGATGRLALSTEFLWRTAGSGAYRENIVAFMAGGDCALISSIEKFEDYPEFGSRHLMELGFSEDDLLIGVTEGGETPFVIGAVEKASEISKRPPFFLYCNPDDILSKVAKRSKRVLENDHIHKINLSVGPMAISGSTRMQATTVQMIALASCLLFHNKPFTDIEKWFDSFARQFETTDLNPLAALIKNEAKLYQEGKFITYVSDAALGICVLTDTTERSPTFSLKPFENRLDHSANDPSLCYLTLENAEDNESAWKKLLGRRPRTFHWKEISDKTTEERLLGFDISEKVLIKRQEITEGKNHIFRVSYGESGHHSSCLELSLGEEIFKIQCDRLDLLGQHMILKLILNNLSTSIMGILGRYEGNVMTWVRPSNYKLIDRCIRYIQAITAKKNIHLSYTKTAEYLFSTIPETNPGEPVVLNTVYKIEKDVSKEFAKTS